MGKKVFKAFLYYNGLLVMIDMLTAGIFSFKGISEVSVDAYRILLIGTLMLLYIIGITKIAHRLNLWRLMFVVWLSLAVCILYFYIEYAAGVTYMDYAYELGLTQSIVAMMSCITIGHLLVFPLSLIVGMFSIVEGFYSGSHPLIKG